MKPGFALSLSSEGITLLHRAAGGWRNIGTVAFDHPDLAAALNDLRAAGDALSLPDPDCCKVVIPNDQIRYLTIETGAKDPRERRRLAAAALEGQTPYAVEDLAYDISEDGELTHIAAVARETLEEAEGFAVEHGFTPASFVAIPGDMDFLGEPFFGQAQSIGDSPIEPDGIAIVDIGPAGPPALTAEAEPKTEPAPTIPAAPAPLVSGPPPEQPPADRTDTAVQVRPDASGDTSSRAISTRKGLILTAAANLTDADSTLAQTAQDSAEEDLALGGPTPGFSTRRRKTAGTDVPPAEASTETAIKPLAGATRDTVSASNGSGVPSAVVATKTGPDAGKSERTPSAPDLKAQERRLASTLAAAAKARPVPAPPPAASGFFAKAAPADRTGERAASGPNGAPGEDPRGPAKDRSAAMAATLRKNMGLILTVLLLLFMLAVGAVAYVTGAGPFARFRDAAPADEAPQPATQMPAPAETAPFETPPAEPESAPSQEGGTPLADPETPLPMILAEPDQRPIAPQVSVLPDQPDPGVVFLPQSPDSDSQPELGSVDDALSTDPESAGTSEPDLDADLAEQEALEQAAQYAATGIWQTVPEIADVPALVNLDSLYVASIDHTNLSQDAVALPPQPDLSRDEAPNVVSSPAAAGNTIALDQRGLVTATPEGTVNPDGVVVYSGRPPVVPPPTPARADPEALAAEAAAEAAEQARLAALALQRPRTRPTDLTEQAERAQLGGRSLAELATIRPRPRPDTLKTEEQESQPATEQAIAISLPPRSRPANFANIVDRAQRSSVATSTAAAAPAVATPRIPSSASVARQATVSNAINLRELNLIGVYGAAADRRALVRLPSGRYRKVQVGDRLDGGQVVAIGDAQLQYQKNGRNQTLKIPQ